MSYTSIFLAFAVVTVYSAPDSRTGSDFSDRVSGLTTNSPQSTTVVSHAKDTTEKDLSALLDAGDNAIVTLIAGNTRLVAHRALLATRSPVLAAKLEANNSLIVVPDVEGPVLRHLLALLYTLEGAQLPSITPQLQAAADRYGVSVLRAECRQQEGTPLSVETAAATAVTAVRHSCTNLRQAAIAFIKAHAAQVIASQGWEDAVHNWPKEVVKVSRLVFDVPAETSTPATADNGTSPTTQPDSGTSPTTQPDSGTSPTAQPGSGTSPTTQPDSHHGDPGQTLVTAAPANASCLATTPNPRLVSLLRNLSREETSNWLFRAAKAGEVDTLRALLAADVDLGMREEGWRQWTALHWTAVAGSAAAARCLLDAGAAVDARDGWRRTPLHMAAFSGNEEVAMSLIEAGADVGARDIDQETPLHEAAGSNNAAIVRLLAKASADVNAIDGRGWTPLHLAAVNGFAKAARALVEAGVDKCTIKALDADRGKTPLDLAKERNEQEVVAILQ